MDNFNMDVIMSMLSKMDKKDLEEGIKRATEILNNKDGILNNLNKK